MPTLLPLPPAQGSQTPTAAGAGHTAELKGLGTFAVPLLED